MGEAEIRFDPAGLQGIVPVGTYLAAAARRMGLRELECDIPIGEHLCVVKVTSGAELLSHKTDAETELLPPDACNDGHRLACFARVESPGEVVVMTAEKKKDEKNTPEHESEEYKKKFAELPLEKKISNLVELEAMALSETFSFVLNSPYKVAGKFMDVLAEFGFRKEEEERKAAHPGEEAAGAKSKKETAGGAKPKRKPRRPKAKPAADEQGTT